MKRRAFWARFFLVASILTAGLIFWFSAQKGAASQSMSDGMTLRLSRFLRPGDGALSEAFLNVISTIIRKGAHFSEFALLGFNLYGYIRLRRREDDPRGARWKAWGIASLYGCSDELHQLFVSERAARLLDMLIDSAGGLAGCLVGALLLGWILKKAK